MKEFHVNLFHYGDTEPVYTWVYPEDQKEAAYALAEMINGRNDPNDDTPSRAAVDEVNK